MALPVSVLAWQTIPDSEFFYSFQKFTPCPQSPDLKAEHTITEDTIETHPSSLASVSLSELEEADCDFSVPWIFQGLWGHWHRIAVLDTVWQAKCQRNPPIDLSLIFNQLIHLTWHDCSKVRATWLENTPWLCPPHPHARLDHALSLTSLSDFPLTNFLTVWIPVAFSLLIMWCIEAPVATLPCFPYDQSLHIPHLKTRLNQHSYRFIALR